MTRWEENTYNFIVTALRCNGGVARRAAEWMGVSSRTIRNYMAKYPELRELLCEDSKKASDSILATTEKKKLLPQWKQ